MRSKKLLTKMARAIGREIRYVEYKLRRQQQEKKKKKQSRQDWLNGANATTTAPNEAGEVKKTSEFNFNDEQNTGDDGKMVAKGKFETDRPQNRQEEDLQLEVRLLLRNSILNELKLALAMSRDDAQQEDEQPVVQTSAPQTSAPQIASLLDFDSAPPVAAAPPPQQQSFSPWGAPAPQAAAPLSVPAQPQWESFTGECTILLDQFTEPDKAKSQRQWLPHLHRQLPIHGVHQPLQLL